LISKSRWILKTCVF